MFDLSQYSWAGVGFVNACVFGYALYCWAAPKAVTKQQFAASRDRARKIFIALIAVDIILYILGVRY